ncbi:MAG TPA: PAAR-like protein [Pilimelia sp.]|nr:PAAR-like protein [Pilimelia sp.]
MPGFLLHVGATVLCAHGGQAMPTAPNPRVTVGGQPVVTQAAPYTVAGCAFVPPAGNGPCVTAQWIVGATRVLVGGQPALLQDSQAICTPTGTPLTVVVTQVRAKGM